MRAGVRVRAMALASLLALAALPALATAPACLEYEPAQVRLEGTLALQVFPGPPHYRSFESGDQPESIWLLQLDAPICIAALASEIGSIALQDVRTIRIVPRTTLALSLNGHAARLDGTLYRPRDGHAHALVLLRTTHAEAAAR